jgi:signal transduction histidine kinase
LQGNYFIISISDNGIGIEEDKLSDIFTKYYRVDHTIEGSGIGLYLVREIVNNSGGKVEINSEPGKGTEIQVFLKAEAAAH